VKDLQSFVGALCITVTLPACAGGALTPAANNFGARTAVPATSSSGYQLLYRFKGTPDGASPLAGLIALRGKLYGTTLGGSKNYCSQSCGSNGCYLGCGTIFSVDASGKERVVYNFRGNFNGAQDGSRPFSPLALLHKKLYGTTASDGANGYGTVFTVSTRGKERVLYSFEGGGDAASPEAGLTPLNGELYGATLSGGGSGCGGSGCGAVFAVTPTGTERVIYGFQGGSDGERLFSGVTALHRKLYGATLFGGSGCGSSGCGTIYEVSLSGKKRTLYTFTGGSDGAYPNGLIAVNNVLYGTTEGGGAKGSGTIFSITPSGTEKTLYAFQDIPDGNGPGADLIYYSGSLYGTTVGGGTQGNGTVFKVTTSGTETVLYSFMGGSDGKDPQGPVYLYNNELYGTTYQGGGTSCTSSGTGCGTIFKLNP
jgi:uncharacterized repeat protein (TIGR03803 family)